MEEHHAERSNRMAERPASTENPTPSSALRPGTDHITVCICTYRRPEYLRQLLEELTRQETEGRFTFSVVVADNDRNESARSVVDDFCRAAALEVVYCVQPLQNISLTRNLALSRARGDYVAFIDDDEFPISDWLLRLYGLLTSRGVAGVLGPVKPHFERQPPRWVVKGMFYERSTHPTGYAIRWREGRTGNVLFCRTLFAGLDQPFDPQFLTGEDQDFYRRMIAAGHVFLWCDEAVAYEHVPAHRWDLNFMLRRALLRGKVSLRHEEGRAKSLVKSAVALPLYALCLPFALLAGYHHFVRILVSLFDHGGRLLAWLGIEVVREAYVTQ